MRLELLAQPEPATGPRQSVRLSAANARQLALITNWSAADCMNGNRPLVVRRVSSLVIENVGMRGRGRCKHVGGGRLHSRRGHRRASQN